MMTKCVPLYLLWITMMLLAAGCGGGGCAATAPTAQSGVLTKQVALAERLASAHLDNGAFD